MLVLYGVFAAEGRQRERERVLEEKVLSDMLLRTLIRCSRGENEVFYWPLGTTVDGRRSPGLFVILAGVAVAAVWCIYIVRVTHGNRK